MNRVRRSHRRYSRANSNHSPATLLEISRKNLVGKTKKQSPQRYKRKVNYRAKAFDGIDVNELFNTGELVIRVPVGDYICTVAYDNIFKELWKVVTAQNIPQITLQSCIKALQRSIDNQDILVDCQCPDFKYRFSYWATKYGYKYGKPETRPAKITNPHDSIGAMCKHLTCLLANKRWLVKLAVSLNKVIQDNYDELENVMDMDGIIKLGRGQSIISYNTNRAGEDDYRTQKDEPDDVRKSPFKDDESTNDSEAEEPEDTDDELELEGDE